MKAPQWITYVVAVIGLIVYGYFTVVLYNKFISDSAPANDLMWQHAVVLYNGVVSIAFSCAGVLLGVTVQQVRVTEAQKEVDDKKDIIKRAADKLQGQVAAPRDVGAGGPRTEESRASEALEILRRGL